MRFWMAAMAAVGLAGCRGPEMFAAPAPAGALDCALREAEEIGYRKLEGRDGSGMVLVGRYLPPPPAREPTDPEVRLSDRQGTRFEDGPFNNQLRITERSGMLRIEVVAVSNERDVEIDPGGPSGDARMILAQCTTTRP